MSTIFAQLALARIVPVVEITDASRAVELAHTLAAGGLPVMEVTLRTPAALDAIRAIRAEVPDFIVGAGTLLTAGQIALAHEAGAHFGVSPGFTPTLSAAASDLHFPFVPGTVTASEILVAAEHGHTHLKFFPAEQSGGAAIIGSLAAPLAAHGIHFMPTGGIRPAGLGAYLSLANVFAVGGTWVAPRDAITAGRFDHILAATRSAVAAAAPYSLAKEFSS
jgi:2-dehydro-3-deoxyphosphogluconate aldolase/(4S)-4-hydroxy-2-oxoglutarate aldolase